MIKDIKELLLKDPDAIVELLQDFGFENIRLNSREIRFARDHRGGMNISIRLENNPNVAVNDFARSVHMDIFSYIMQEKNVTLRDVLASAKRILGLGDNWKPKPKAQLFGGIYSNISKRNNNVELKTYPESVLEEYENIPCRKFLDDGISLEAQKGFGIRFSTQDQAIIIPIRNEFGDLIGTKARLNGEVQDGESKYFYPLPTMASQTLFGLSTNYRYLYGADEIFIGESEKFCMQLYTIGIRNCVSLGSHTLSEKQSKLLLQLAPKNIVFMMDQGLPLEETKKNAETLRKCMTMMDVGIKFFDWRDCNLLGEKDSPSDHGKNIFDDIVNNYVKDISELEERPVSILDEIDDWL